jgi:hypothetical protein
MLWIFGLPIMCGSNKKKRLWGCARLFQPMYAWANMGHPSRGRGLFCKVVTFHPLYAAGAGRSMSFGGVSEATDLGCTGKRNCIGEDIICLNT